MDEELQQQWFLYCPEYLGHSALLILAVSAICPVQDFPVTQLSFPAYESSLIFLKLVLILIFSLILLFLRGLLFLPVPV